MSRRTIAILAAVAVIVGLVVGLVAVGSGDDDADEETSLPEISVPQGEPQTVPSEEKPKPEPEPPPKDTGGTGPGGGPPPSQEDTATNDKPPPPGSPAERFEQFCEQNPAACG